MSASDHLQPQQFFHGTHARLNPGDMIEPGHEANWDSSSRQHVYLTSHMAAAYDYGIEASARRGGGPEPRAYEVDPTGQIEDDPEYEGHGEIDSYRTGSPLRVRREVTGRAQNRWEDWQAERMGL